MLKVPKIAVATLWEFFWHHTHTTHLKFTVFDFCGVIIKIISFSFSTTSSSLIIMTGINGISFKDSKDDRAKVAIERIEQLKGQLNLSSSPMSRQAPKDIEAERAQAEFSIEALTHLFYGGPERYKVVKRAYEYIKNDPLLVAQPPRNFVEFNKDEMREL